jgi:hypothetical protein
MEQAPLLTRVTVVPETVHWTGMAANEMVWISAAGGAGKIKL